MYYYYYLWKLNKLLWPRKILAIIIIIIIIIMNIQLSYESKTPKQ